MVQKLKHYFQEDQHDRRNPKLAVKKMARRDAKRRREILRMLLEQKIRTGADFYYAAFILHHSPHKADSRRTIHLAQESVRRGYRKAKWLYAATIDRFLIKNGKPQKFGTQFLKKRGGRWCLLPVNPDTTDVERAKFNVPKLSQLKKQTKSFNN